MPAVHLALLGCTLCGKTCKRAAVLSCCGLASQACRSCAVKRITESRTCWSCDKPGLSTQQLVNCKELREACKWFEEHKKLEDHMVDDLKKMRNSVTKIKKENLKEKEREMFDALMKRKRCSTVWL